jgi:hypothetical protein
MRRNLPTAMELMRRAAMVGRAQLIGVLARRPLAAAG